jgi:hypothetical protein
MPKANSAITLLHSKEDRGSSGIVVSSPSLYSENRLGPSLSLFHAYILQALLNRESI